MNMVGKIFVFLIFTMSMVFASFAVFVYATHKNWRDEVLREQAVGTKPVGWKLRLENEQKLNTELRNQKKEVEDKLAAEQAARRQAIAKLEAEKSRLLAEYAEKDAILREKENSLAAALANVDTTQKEINILTTEVDTLRGEIRLARGRIEEKFKEIVGTTEEVSQVTGELKRVEQRAEQLDTTLAKAKKVIEAAGTSIDAPLDPQDVVIAGVITKVAQREKDIFVEMSIGSDDGVSQGIRLEISRGGKYVGALDVVRVTPDRSVGKIKREVQKDRILAGDKVFTRRTLES